MFKISLRTISDACFHKMALNKYDYYFLHVPEIELYVFLLHIIKQRIDYLINYMMKKLLSFSFHSKLA